MIPSKIVIPNLSEKLRKFLLCYKNSDDITSFAVLYFCYPKIRNKIETLMLFTVKSIGKNQFLSINVASLDYYYYY